MSSDPSAPIRAIVYSHAHWDLEWYLARRAFLFWTVELFDRTLDLLKANPDYSNFMTDGQVAPVLDYLERRPERGGEIRALVQSGRLSIGPFFTQADEWLPSPEALLRNLQTGMKSARAMGRAMRSGYLPDNFGHPAQLPQILRGFGIDHLVFSRGMGDHPDGMGQEFEWMGPDGSRVLAIHLGEGYGNAYNVWGTPGVDPISIRPHPYGGDPYLGFESHLERTDRIPLADAAEAVVQGSRRALPRHGSGIIPLASGADHCPPQSILPSSLKRAAALAPEIGFSIGDTEAIAHAIREHRKTFPVMTGEFWGSRYQYLLSGILAIRPALKRAHFLSESLVTHYVEPLTTLAMLEGFPAPKAEIAEAWSLLFQNHAHDSIHGSCLDAVHVEMAARYHGVEQLAVGVLHGALAELGKRRYTGLHADRRTALVYSPMASGRLPRFAECWAPIGDEPQRAWLGEIEQVVQILPRPEGTPESPSRRVPWPLRLERNLLVRLEAPSRGRVESVTLGTGKGPHGTDLLLGPRGIGNRFLDLQWGPEGIVVVDRVRGRRYADCHRLVVESDRGDVWTCSPIPGTRQETRIPSENPEVLEAGPVRCRVRWSFQVSLPCGTDPDAEAPPRVSCPATLTATLWSGVPYVAFRLELDNRGKHFRLRLETPAAIPTGTVTAMAPFEVRERPLRPAPQGPDWQEQPVSTRFFREWVSLADGVGGLALAARGIHEYEGMDLGEGRAGLALTLLRAVGVMSRRNLPERSGEASWGFPLPGAQSPGLQVFEYAFLVFGGREDLEGLLEGAHHFLYPSVTHLIRRDPKAEPATGAESAGPMDLVRPEGNQVIQTAQKSWDEAPDGTRGFILRWFNPGSNPVRVRAKVHPAIESLAAVAMDERPRPDPSGESMGRLPIRDGWAEIDFGPHEIVTLLARWEPKSP